MRINKLCFLTILLVLCPFPTAAAQFGFNSKREKYDVPIVHQPLLNLAKVRRLAVSDFRGPGSCGEDIQARLEEGISQSNKLELIDRANLGSILGEQQLQSSMFADPTAAVKLGKLLGPAAIITGQVLRCDADTSALKRDAGYVEKKTGIRHYTLYRETTAHVAVLVRVIDITTSKVHTARRIAFDVPKTSSARDAYPEIVDGGEIIGELIGSAVVPEILHSVIPWTETVSVTVHADKECDLRPAAGLIRTASFDAAADLMAKAIARQCDAPTDKIALAKAYHNMGVALTYSGKLDEGLAALRQANMLWPGNISEEAMTATQKLITSREEQARASAQEARASSAVAAEEKKAAAGVMSNDDVISMVNAKLSDRIIIGKIAKARCRFDTSPKELVRLKRAGASDAVVVAVTEASCGN